MPLNDRFDLGKVSSASLNLQTLESHENEDDCYWIRSSVRRLHGSDMHSFVSAIFIVLPRQWYWDSYPGNVIEETFIITL